MPTGRHVRPPDPTPEEIARICAEIREEWSERKWQLQTTAKERHWDPLYCKEPKF